MLDSEIVKPRKSWLSGLLSLVVPGLGQLYNGQFIKAIAFSSSPFLFSSFYGLIDSLINPIGITFYVLFFLLLILYSAIDSFITSLRSKDYRLKSINNGIYYTTFAILSLGLNALFLLPNSIAKLAFFSIPTPAMEQSLLVGDRIVAGFHRINASVQRNEVVVFRVPGVRENNFSVYDTAAWVYHEIDQKIPYIKRCVAIAGDKLEIKNDTLIVNNQVVELSSDLLFSYNIVSTESINDRSWNSFSIEPHNRASDYGEHNNSKYFIYRAYLSFAQVNELKTKPFIVDVSKQSQNFGALLFPFNESSKSWSASNYGPITIPQKGMSIPVNDSTLSIYGSTIKDYENLKDVMISNNQLMIDGKEVTEYIFNQNYYFMMGDSRDNSHDSRYWGFVPEDHLIGKAYYVYMSVGKQGNFRLNRIFQPIR
ncbi:MAG: signal peptidase I [Cyclobacteriaceae bacterium]|nr:signal peptidase I [Cyclobacteriaceae bacterium]